MTDTPPDKHQLEISVFGPGIGESIAVHIGDGDWIVIDSCINRLSGQPAALEYLDALGVNPETQVKLVIATHWHDDHIKGLAEILRRSKSAKFVNSAAYALRSLTQVVKLGGKTAPQSSATKELDGILQLLVDRKQQGEKKDATGPVPAAANKKLLVANAQGRTVAAEVVSLSPADAVFNLAEAELRAAISAIEGRRRPRSPGPNQLCVVLWLKVGVLDILLGADLEHAAGATEGWNAIVSSQERPEGRAGFFKVPHHGSENADCPECWGQLLRDAPIAIVTPYSPAMLPRPADLTRLCQRTKWVYQTSDHTHFGVPRRDNAVEKTMRETALTRRALVGQMGHVRLRVDARDANAGPLIRLQNGAQQRCA